MIDDANIFVATESDLPGVIPGLGQHQRLQLRDESGNSILLEFESLAAACACWQSMADWILIMTSGRTEATNKAMSELEFLRKDPGPLPF